MRGRLLNPLAIGRSLGFVLVAIAMVATVLHLRRDARPTPSPLSQPWVSADRLAAELTRCRTLALAAKDDARCEAAWAENRRRFFTYAPGATPAHAGTPKKVDAQ